MKVAMEIIWRHLFIVLMSQTLSETLLQSLQPHTQLNRWELISSSIIQSYFSSLYDVQISCQDDCVSNHFLKMLSVPVRLSEPRLQDNSILILLARNQHFVTKMLDSSANSTKSKFVIFFDCDDCVTVAWISQQCWQRYFLNVVVIPLKDETLSIYTYFPFAAGACSNPSPVLLGNFTNSVLNSVELFPHRKVWDLQNCILKVSAYTTLEITFEDGHMKGPYSPILYAVASAMNFRPEFINTDGKVGAGIVSAPQKTGLRGDVYTRQAHLGFSLVQPMDFAYLDYDSLALTACLTWFVPSILIKKSIWWIIVGEFAPSVWCLLILSACCMVVFDMLAQKIHFKILSPRNTIVYHYLDSWAALLQSSAGKLRFSFLSTRVLWISWLLVSLVLATGYLSTLKSFRAAPLSENSVKNLQDLGDAGFEAWHPKPFGNMMKDISKRNAAVSKLMSHSVPYTAEMWDTMRTLLRLKKITLLGMKRECRMWAEKSDAELYTLPDSCMLITTMHFFVMAKHSVFTEAVTTIMGRLTQAGIIQWCLGEYRKDIDVKHNPPTPMTFQNVFSCLILLASGLSVSTVIFLFECIMYRVWHS